MYTIDKQTANGVTIAVVRATAPVIVDAATALDLLMDAKYNADSNRIAIDKSLVAEEFFILSSGMPGEILQKYVNYGGKIAFYGDFSRYTSKPLQDFIRESNKGRDVFFVATQDAAIEKLANAR